MADGFKASAFRAGLVHTIMGTSGNVNDVVKLSSAKCSTGVIGKQKRPANSQAACTFRAATRMLTNFL